MTHSENAPKVSIIIPVFNVKSYLVEALESVVNQTYKNLEIIVVDDGSNDGSEKICDEYAQKDNRIKVIHKENKGLSAARNTGLNIMTGEYVAFLDSDDALHPETVEKTVRDMLSNPVDIVVFKISFNKTSADKMSIKNGYVDDKTQNLPEGIYSRNEILNAVIDNQINVSVWNKLYKRNIWDNLRFAEGHVYEDVDIVLKILYKADKIYVSDNVLIMYRQRSDSITKIYSLQNIKDKIRACNNLENFAEAHCKDIFTIGQLKKLYLKYFSLHILFCAKFLSIKLQDKKEIIELLKGEIKKRRKKIEMRNCTTEIRFTYFLIFRCPIIIKLFRPMYVIIRKFIRGHINK